MAKSGSRAIQERHKSAQERPRSAKSPRGRAKKGAKSGQQWLKIDPRATRERLKSGSRAIQERPKSAQERPQWRTNPGTVNAQWSFLNSCLKSQNYVHFFPGFFLVTSVFLHPQDALKRKSALGAGGKLPLMGPFCVGELRKIKCENGKIIM